MATDYSLYLKRGKGNATPADTLAKAAGFTNRRSLQQDIAKSRAEGQIILSATKGYYLPADREEIKKYKNLMETRAKHCFKIAGAARQALEDINGQMSLSDDGKTLTGKREVEKATDYSLYLKIGKGNATPADTLAKAAGFTNIRSLRKDITNSRHAGQVICFSAAGYYLPAGREEIKAFIKSMESMGKSTMKSAKAARQALQDIDGQMSLSDNEKTLTDKYTDGISETAGVRISQTQKA